MKFLLFLKETIQRWRVHLVVKYHLPLSRERLGLRVGIFLDKIELKRTKSRISYLKRKLYILEFVESFVAFCKLFQAGFRIKNGASEFTPGFEINRFYWNGVVIKDMADIDRVDDHYNTVFNGHVERLS